MRVFSSIIAYFQLEVKVEFFSILKAFVSRLFYPGGPAGLNLAFIRGWISPMVAASVCRIIKEPAMKRPAKDYLIFPLDVSSPEAARHYIDLLCDHVGMFKIGLELFIRSGPEIVRAVRAAGSAGVFLDLKLHDIPATVSRAMSQVADLGVTFATVHCAGGSAMLTAAVAGARGKVGVLGVTVLTSLSAADLAEVGIATQWADDIGGLVGRRAAMARAAGCAGIVCSGLEAAAVKSRFGPDFAAVTPGIRPLDETAGPDDQQRVTTPAQAVENGADYLVIGRPIRDAADPVDAARCIAAEIDSVR
jgi:orotidine-5'-phosphate decarboxylase